MVISVITFGGLWLLAAQVLPQAVAYALVRRSARLRRDSRGWYLHVRPTGLRVFSVPFLADPSL